MSIHPALRFFLSNYPGVLILTYVKSESPKGVTKLLNGHKSTVKALTFLPEGDQDENSFLVSGSDDKTVIIWKAPRNSDEFKPIHTSTEHTAAINCIAALRIKGAQKWVIATGSADASIKIWNFENDQLTLLQSVKTTPKYFPMCLSLSYAGDEDDVLVLASAGTRDIVQIFTAETKSENAQFNVQATLTGHEGWIRSLSFAKETCAPDSDLLLASASQDKYVRIWRFHQGRELPAAAASGFKHQHY